MRKFLVLMLLAACCLLVGCEGGRVEEMTSLPELSRPYVGEYRCTRLTLGEENLLPDFERLTLTLGEGGEAVLSWRREGGEGERRFAYSVDVEGKCVTFSGGRRGQNRTFPMQNGGVRVELLLGGRLLYALFER